MRVYLLRHGETAWNAQGRYLGRTDLPLTEAGRAALRKADLAPEAVFVSPLGRAAETAAILFPQARQIVVPDLREMDFGLFEGRGWRDMEDFAPYREWVDGDCRGPVPEGESMEAFCARTCAAFGALMDQAAASGAKRLAVVATAAPRWRCWSGSPCPGGTTFPGGAPWGAASCWTAPAGGRSAV